MDVQNIWLENFVYQGGDVSLATVRDKLMLTLFAGLCRHQATKL